MELEKPPGSKQLFLPKKALEIYGCKNCIWKNYSQCPKGFTEPDQSVDGGYCTEFGEFILGFGEPEDGISAVMQKFFVYTQQMQAMADNTEFNKKFQEVKKFKANSTQYQQELGLEGYKQKLGELEMAATTSKIWWSRLTEAIVKALGQIADRERRSKDVQGTKKITVQQLNVLLKESDEKIKELK